MIRKHWNAHHTRHTHLLYILYFNILYLHILQYSHVRPRDQRCTEQTDHPANGGWKAARDIHTSCPFIFIFLSPKKQRFLPFLVSFYTLFHIFFLFLVFLIIKSLFAKICDFICSKRRLSLRTLDLTLLLLFFCCYVFFYLTFYLL